jgi:hypothetical protein
LGRLVRAPDLADLLLLLDLTFLLAFDECR